MFKGIIFDLDGTILDSLEMRVTAWKIAFQHFDIDVSRDELRPLIGLPGEALAGRYYKDPKEVEGKEEEYFSSHLEEISLFDDVAKGKPDPESYLKAVNMIKIEPAQLVVVGDSDNDLIPARRIGALTVLVRHGRDIEAENADYYADEISEIPSLIEKRCKEMARTEDE
jgi:phosphoglycolate phosphatase